MAIQASLAAKKTYRKFFLKNYFLLLTDGTLLAPSVECFEEK